jgi:hypothetical protein
MIGLSRAIERARVQGWAGVDIKVWEISLFLAAIDFSVFLTIDEDKLGGFCS